MKSFKRFALTCLAAVLPCFGLVAEGSSYVCTDGSNGYASIKAAVDADAPAIILLADATVAEDLTVTAPIYGNFGITVSAGTLTLSGENFVPTLTISAGTVIANHADALSATTTVAADATLTLSDKAVAATTLTVNGTLNLNGQAVTVDTLEGAGTITGGGSLTVRNLYSFTGSADGVTLNIPDPIENALGYDLIWLPVGDSITEGEQYMGSSSDASAGAGYRYQLWSQLTARGQEMRTVGFRTGHSGTNEDPGEKKWAYHAALYGGDIIGGSSGAQIFNVESTLEVAGYPDFISVLIGINDLSRETQTDASRQLHYNAWAELVDRYAKLRPNSTILAVTLLPVVDGNASADDFDPFNTLIRNAAENKTTPFDNENVILADIAAAAFGNTYNSAYFKDAVHPNLAGSSLVANAFRSVIVDRVITPLKAAKPIIVNVNNATTGKITVLFSKPIKSVSDGATVTVAGTDIAGNSVNETCAYEAYADRAVTFTIPDGTTLIAGDYTVTLNGTVTDVTDVVSDENLRVTTFDADEPSATACVEIHGSGAAENVPASFRRGFVRYQSLNVAGHVNYGGALPTDADGFTTHQTTGLDSINKAAYYVELQRPGKAPQFVWVSMDARVFENSALKATIPTEAQGNVKSRVEDLAVYGNRGNFTKAITGEQGVIEFSPWSYGGAEETGYPEDMSDGVTGWNDTLATSALFGSMQVARVRSERDITKNKKYDPEAEMLFAFNGFNSGNSTDLAIGSMVVHRNNAGGQPEGLPNYDWTRFYERTQYPDFNLDSTDAYTVKKIEIWVAPTTTWTGEAGVAGDWTDATKWSNGVPTADVEAIIPAGSAMTLTADAEAYAIAISAVEGQNTVSISGAHTLALADTVTIAEGQTLALNSVTLDGDVAGEGTLHATGTLPDVTGLTEPEWTGRVVLDTITVENLNLSEFGHAASSITIRNLTGHWDHNLVGTNATNSANWKVITIPAALCIEGVNTINDGYARQAYNLSGAITGEGSLVFGRDAVAAQGIYCFTGNISGFTGNITDNVGNPIVSIGELLTYDAALAGTCNIFNTQVINCTINADNGVNVASGAVVSGRGVFDDCITTFASGAEVDATNQAVLLTVKTLAGTVHVKMPAVADGQTEADVLAANLIFKGTTPDVADAVIESVTFGETAGTNGYYLISDETGCKAAVKTSVVRDVGTLDDLKEALEAIAEAGMGGTLTLTANITLDSDTLSEETLVIDAGADNTVTLNLGGFSISSSSVPAVRIQSGTLLLSGNGSVESTQDVGVICGATDDAGAVSTEACALTIGADVTISSAEVVSGTIGGEGVIVGKLELMDNAWIDATRGLLTVGDQIVFPGLRKRDETSDELVPSNVFVKYPEDTVFPRIFAKCSNASATHALEAETQVKQTTFYVNDVYHSNYGLTTEIDNATGAVTGYALKQYVCVGGHGANYLSVAEALAAQEKSITLFEDTAESVILPSGVTLKLRHTLAHTLTGNVVVKSGATLVPQGGIINGDLTFEDGSVLDLSFEFANTPFFTFTVTGDVVFPENAFTVIVDSSAEGSANENEVLLGEPRRLIACPGLMPAPVKGTDTGLVVKTGETGGVVVSNNFTKIVATSTSYVLVNVDSGPCTYDGVDYANIAQALRAFTAVSNRTITLNRDITSEDLTTNEKGETVDGTIVINVGDGNEVTLDLNGHNLTSSADPAIRIQSGKLNLINSKLDETTGKPTAVKVFTIAATEDTAPATTILVGASTDEGKLSTGVCALTIGEGVTVARTAETVAVDVLAGTVGGAGTITGTLALGDRTLVDVTTGALTVTDATFPAGGVVTVLPPADAIFPAKVIACERAEDTAVEETGILIQLSDGSSISADTTHTVSDGFKFIAMTPEGKDKGYYLNTGVVAVTVDLLHEEILYYTTVTGVLNAVAGNTNPTLTLIPMADMTLTGETTIPCNVYTYGYDIIAEAGCRIEGSLALANGTQIPAGTTLTAQTVTIEQDAAVTIAGKLVSSGDTPIIVGGTLTGLKGNTITGQLSLVNGSALAGTLAPSGGTVVEADVTVTIDGTLTGDLTVKNATVGGIGTITIGSGNTLTGAGTIQPTVTLADGAVINKAGYESTPIQLPKLTAFDTDNPPKITVTAGTLAHVLTTPTSVTGPVYNLTMAADSAYVAYHDQTSGDNVATVAAVQKADGTCAVGVVKVNFVLGGVVLQPAVANQLAWFAYRERAILAVEGVYPDSDDPQGFACFTNTVTGFVGNLVVINYDFGVTDVSVKDVTVGENDAAVTTRYVVVTVEVDGPYDGEPDSTGHAGFRRDTQVTLSIVDEAGEPVMIPTVTAEGIAYSETEAVTATELTVENAATCGFELDAIPAGVKYFIMPFDDLFPGELEAASETLKIKAHAANETQQNQ